MIFDPLEDRIVILPDETPTEYSTGSLTLAMPNAIQKAMKPIRGTVKFVGPGTDRHPMKLKVGDKVIYGAYAGTPVEDEDDKKVYLFMRTADVFSRIFATEQDYHAELKERLRKEILAENDSIAAEQFNTKEG
jgi:chaperonin GroES